MKERGGGGGGGGGCSSDAVEPTHDFLGSPCSVTNCDDSNTDVPPRRIERRTPKRTPLTWNNGGQKEFSVQPQAHTHLTHTHTHSHTYTHTHTHTHARTHARTHAQKRGNRRYVWSGEVGRPAEITRPCCLQLHFGRDINMIQTHSHTHTHTHKHTHIHTRTHTRGHNHRYP